MSSNPGAPAAGPAHDCPFCPRLVEYRHANRAAHPDWFNGPVPGWGDRGAAFLVVGMAPGLKGANRTGRPFTGDQSGLLLYRTLLAAGFARRDDAQAADDGLELVGCRIVNAVRCVPPANLPKPAETRMCNGFLAGELAAMPRLRVIMALGVLAHAAVLRACGIPPSRVRFRHGGAHALAGGRTLIGCYHVSRYNTNTGRLTAAMVHAVVDDVGTLLGHSPG